MKKILLLTLFIFNLFGLSLEDRVEQLEKRVGDLEQQLHKTQKTQSKIVENVEKGVIVPKCDKLTIETYSYKLKDMGFYKGYDFSFNFKNGYKKEIQNFEVIIQFIDNDDVLLVQDDLIKNNVNIKFNQTKKITDSYLIDDDLASYLATTPKEKIKLKIKPLTIKFKDGTKLKCYK